jgi:hypothetical protein
MNPELIDPENLRELRTGEVALGEEDFADGTGRPLLLEEFLLLEALIQLFGRHVPTKMNHLPERGFGIVVFQKIVPEGGKVRIVAHD